MPCQAATGKAAPLPAGAMLPAAARVPRHRPRHAAGTVPITLRGRSSLLGSGTSSASSSAWSPPLVSHSHGLAAWRGSLGSPRPVALGQLGRVVAAAAWRPGGWKRLVSCSRTPAKHLQQAGASSSPALVEKQPRREVRVRVSPPSMPAIWGGGPRSGRVEQHTALRQSCWSLRHPWLSHAASGTAWHRRDTG